MPQDYYSLVTDGGLIKEAASNEAGGSTIDLTEIAVGDGGGVVYDPVSSATALVNEVYRIALTHVVVDENNPNQLIVEGVLDETIGPFYIREVGIFDSNGDLFAIGKYPETFKPNLPSGSGKRLYIRMILGFANAPNVNLVINNDIALDPNFGTDVNNSLNNRLKISENLADLENTEAARINMGLEINSDVQPYSESLSYFSNIVGEKNKILYFKNNGEISLTNLFSNKNLIINGCFNIWQRGNSFNNISSRQYTSDRWECVLSGFTNFNISRSLDVPTINESGEKFNYSLSVENDSAISINSPTDHFYIRHAIEGYNYATIASQSFTISFWVKATKTGIYSIAVKSEIADASCVAEYEISQSDVWEFKIINFPAPEYGTWNYLNGVGIEISWLLIQGSDGQTNIINQWQSLNLSSSTNQANSFESSSNKFNIAGVQLELGDVATQFEQSLFSQQLLRCQRYLEYQAITVVSSSLFAYQTYPWKVNKRTIPTLSAVLGSLNGATLNVAGGNISSDLRASLSGFRQQSSASGTVDVLIQGECEL